MHFPTNKYHNKWTEYNGKKYQSKKEAEYARDLDFRINAGEILDWRPQQRIPIEVNGVHIAYYICDFVIWEKDGTQRYVDIKGMRSGPPYQMFKLKKKLVEALNPDIKIEEV